MRIIVKSANAILLAMMTFYSSYAYSQAGTVNVCDLLAGNPDDLSLPIAGIQFDSINSFEAVIACSEAIKNFPENYRYVYQMGRAFDSMGETELALDYYNVAYEGGHGYSALALAIVYADAEGEFFDLEKAEGLIIENLEENKNFASVMLGSVRLSAYSSSSDAEVRESIDLLVAAADNGSALAAMMLGVVYLEGRVVDRDLEKAEDYLLLSADAGDEEAMVLLANLYEATKSDMNGEIIDLLSSASGMGSGEAAYHLARIYRNGDIAEKNEELEFFYLNLSFNRDYDIDILRYSNLLLEFGSEEENLSFIIKLDNYSNFDKYEYLICSYSEGIIESEDDFSSQLYIELYRFLYNINPDSRCRNMSLSLFFSREFGVTFNSRASNFYYQML